MCKVEGYWNITPKILDDKSEIANISDEKIAELLKDLLSNH